MNLPKFDIDFFDSVLSEWNYKEVYVNNVCVYSVASDVSITIPDFKKNWIIFMPKACVLDGQASI